MGPINLGNPGEFTIKELALAIVRLTKSNSKVTFLDLPGTGAPDPARTFSEGGEVD